MQIPIMSVALMRTLQGPRKDFYLKTKNGQETTGNRMAGSKYEWVGKNESGGMTSIAGGKWRLVKVGD